MSSVPGTPTRLLLVGIDEITCLGLRTLFGHDRRIEVAGEALTSRDATDAVGKFKPHVVLIGTLMTDNAGTATCREILAAGLQTQVIFFTAIENEELIVSALLAGAHGFLRKDISGERLTDAIMMVAAGQTILDPLATRVMAERIQQLSASGVTHRAGDLLSEQEKRVLALVAVGNTNKEIAASLGLSEKTVKNYLHNVFRKLGTSHRSEAAVIYSKMSNP